MRYPQAMIAAAAYLFAYTAHAQSSEEVRDAAEDAYNIAHSLAECAGFWDFMSAVERASGNPASAQNAHNVGNGARLSAGYMLSMRHRLQHPEAAPRAYGSWNDLIEPLAEVTSTRLLAAVEREDMEEVRQQAVVCSAMGETAQEIVDRIRAENSY